MKDKFDVIVVGGGPGGYIAAIRAAQLGLKAALVEEKHLGGICLNWGCIPTKALLKGAEVAHTLNNLSDYGFCVDNIQFDINKLVKHSRNVANKLSTGVAYLLKKNNVELIDGRATVTGKCNLSVTNNGKTAKYSADHIILATGARPRNLPTIKSDGKLIWSYFEAMVPTELPSSIMVIGSGAIGVEFASFYNDLGVDVTIVEIANQLMPAQDKDISSFAQKSFIKSGIKIKLENKVVKLTKNTNDVDCEIQDKHGNIERCTFERIILATGIQGNIENIGLEKLGVETENSFIKTDQWCATNVVGLYAIGDVAGGPCLAHKASHEAVLCVEKLAGVDNVHALDKNRIPACTYCRPQVASIGLTETQVKKSGKQVNIGRFDFTANGKALAIGDNQGFVKTIFDAVSGELLGAHMIGPEVTEQIQGFGLAQMAEATQDYYMNTVFAHPTLSEAMHESILDAYGRGLHQ